MARHNGIIEERLTGENDQLVYYQAVSDFPSFFPSFSEGLSLTLIEACAAAKPIVAANVGGNAEIVEHESNGILVKPGDSKSMASAIIRYLERPDLGIQHGEAGRQRVLKYFSIQAMVRSYEAVYRRLADTADNKVPW